VLEVAERLLADADVATQIPPAGNDDRLNDRHRQGRGQIGSIRCRAEQSSRANER
jgi:hypothetical protein